MCRTLRPLRRPWPGDPLLRPVGGSLAQRLEEAAERFGRDRIALSLERSAEDFSLPSPRAGGAPLTRQQLRQQMDTLRPAVFFSRELCARLLYLYEPGHGAHLSL